MAINILLGMTGSVAAIKADKLFTGMSKVGETKLVVTKFAKNFVDRAIERKPFEDYGERWKPLLDLTNYYNDEREWQWNKIGDPVHHIELKDWADILVIAPLTANTLAKMVNGICDNLLTCIYRAWPVTKPLVIAPAMNTDMWEHPITTDHVYCLNSRHTYRYYGDSIRVAYPISKKLACGTEGVGAMANIEDIVEAVREQHDQAQKTKEEEEKEDKS